MFGFITPFKPEMRMREWNLYKAYYCGLCHTIRQEYGQIPRLVLNYDFVTVAILADAISGEEPFMHSSRCIASPHKKKCYCIGSKGLSLAAAGLIITAYYKLYDDKSDERGAKRLAAGAGLAALRKAHSRAANKYPDLDICLKNQTLLQSKLEAEGCQSPDKAAEPTSQMTGNIFALCSDIPAQKKILFRFGMMLGRIIYFLDAAEDYKEDIDKKRYNVFTALSFESTCSTATELCKLCAGDAALSYNLLNIKQHKEILDNIIFLGIAQSVKGVGSKISNTKKQLNE